MTADPLVELIARAICRASLLKESERYMATGEVGNVVALTLTDFCGVEKYWRDFVPEAREVLREIEQAGFRPDTPAIVSTSNETGKL